MKIDITRLKSGVDSEIPIHEIRTFSKEELNGTSLIELNDVDIEGLITKNNMEDYVLDCNVSGSMVLSCAITLKPVVYPFFIHIQGNIQELLEELAENDKKIENTIDIFPIIWENILVEIPSRVVSEDAEGLSLEGNGWKLCTEEPNEKINPELQKLSDLLNEKRGVD